MISTSVGIIEYFLRMRNQVEEGRSWKGITGGDLLIFVLLFAPLDFRWVYNNYFYGPPSMGYDWWALAITVQALLGWKVFFNLPGFGYRLIPSWKDFVIGIGFMLVLALPVLPIGKLFSDHVEI
jgi:hypothetical protein